MKHTHEPPHTHNQSTTTSRKRGIAAGVFLAVFIGSYFCTPFWPKNVTATSSVEINPPAKSGISLDAAHFETLTKLVGNEDFVNRLGAAETGANSGALKIKSRFENRAVDIEFSAPTPELAAQSANKVAETLAVHWKEKNSQRATLQDLEQQKALIDQSAAEKAKHFNTLSASGANDEQLHAAMREWELTQEKSVLMSAKISNLHLQNTLIEAAAKVVVPASPDNVKVTANPLLRIGGSFGAAALACSGVLGFLTLTRRPRTESSSAPVTLEPKVAVNSVHAGKIEQAKKDKVSQFDKAPVTVSSK
ncbi:MAG: hypothetical protein P1V20_23270 [Verrucomicrobiales bacterium]|nr:hypothetical protein [Verrucomicrobiales bacterium]